MCLEAGVNTRCHSPPSFLRQGLSLNQPGAHDSNGLAGQMALGSQSPSPQHWDYKSMLLCPVFKWVMGFQAQVFVLV